MKNFSKLIILILTIALQSCGNEKTKNAEQEASEKDTVVETPKDKDKALLFDIEGNYSFKDKSSACRLDLKLYYINEQLKYKIKTNTREISDNAKIVLNEKKDGYNITFEKIEWSENTGATDPEGKKSDKKLPLPQEIEGVLLKDEITIQNIGNAMNDYVKLGECDAKYIRLVREK